MLHSEQELKIHRPPMCTAISSRATAQIADLWDNGEAAVIEIRTVAEGEPLFTNRYSLFT
jgi:hypothetical protein